MKREWKRSRPQILFLKGEYAGASLDLSGDEVIRIGSDPKYSNLIIRKPEISDLHCTVRYNEAEKDFIVCDYSRSGIYRENGLRIEKRVPTRIDEGSIVSILPGREVFLLDQEIVSAPIEDASEGFELPAQKKQWVEVRWEEKPKHRSFINSERKKEWLKWILVIFLSVSAIGAGTAASVHYVTGVLEEYFSV